MPGEHGVQAMTARRPSRPFPTPTPGDPDLASSLGMPRGYRPVRRHPQRVTPASDNRRIVDDMTGPGTPDLSPDRPDKDDEVARLKDELAQLKATKAAARRGWWRPVVAGLLVTVAALLAPLSVLATWAQGQIGDTDRYIATVGPLANDPDVQDAIIARVEQLVFTYVDVDAATQELVAAISSQDLPPRVETTLQAVAGPLAAGIRNFISDRIEALVRSDAFEQAWIEANRTAHSQLVAALTGEGGDSVTIDRGSVQINLAVLINTLKQQLSNEGFALAERIPDVQATFTIVESDDLANVQTLLSFLDGLSTWLPAIALVLLAVAILIARDRRHVVLAAGLAVAGTMLLLGAALNLIRPFYLDSLPASSSAAAAGAVYDQLVSFIRLALRGVLVVALAVAIAAWLSASSGAGAAARRGIVRGVAAMRSGRSRAGLQTGRLGLALAEYRTAIRVGVVGIAAVAYLLQDHPTGGTALIFVIVTVVLLVVLEVLAAPPSPKPADTADANEG